MAKIIGLGHYSRTGKSTFSKFLLDELRESGLRVKEQPLAWKLKDICYDLYAWAGLRPPEYYETEEGAKARDIVLPALGLTPVELWVKFGTDAVRENVYERTWLDYVLKGLADFDVLVVPDIRFPNEAEAFKEAGAPLIKIVRPGYGPRNTKADRALLGYTEWDYVFGGSGQLSELRHHAKKMAKWLLGSGPRPVQPAAVREAALAVEVISDAA